MWNNGMPPMNAMNPQAWGPSQDPTLYIQQQQQQMTPEQYKQWEIYYQQYSAWYAQYGEQYAATMAAQGAFPGTPTAPYPNYQPPPPPLPTEPAPPPPSEPSPSTSNTSTGYVAAKAAPVTYQQPSQPRQDQPEMPLHQQHQSQQPYQSQVSSKWGHKPQIKTNQRIQYGATRTMGQQNNQNNNRRDQTPNGQTNIPPNRRIYHVSQPQQQQTPPKPSNNQQPPSNKTTDEPSEEEKFFDDQFTKWEKEFESWRKQNINHPDKKTYAEYERKFLETRAKLLERREQMRRKKKPPAVQVKTEPEDTYQRESPKTWQPQPINSAEIKPEAIFPVVANNAGSIPGFGFDGEDEIKQEPVDTEAVPSSSNKKSAKPLLDLRENIQNAPVSNDLQQQLDTLLENSQVSALLTLVNLTNENLNAIQLNALKPIIEALKQLTGRGDKEIIKALVEVSMRLNNNSNQAEEVPQEPEMQENEPLVHVAAAGIKVMPPVESFQQMQPPPSMNQSWQEFDPSWNQQQSWQQNQFFNMPPPSTRAPNDNPSLNNVQERLLGLSQPNSQHQQFNQAPPPPPAETPMNDNNMFARRNNFRDEFEANFVDYGHQGNRNFGRENFSDYPQNRNQPRNMNNGRNNNNRNQNRRSFMPEESLDYGESNPTYPGKWILISERPPLIRRTKRGKRKNRKGQIIESKKWPGNKNNPQESTSEAEKPPESSSNGTKDSENEENVPLLCDKKPVEPSPIPESEFLVVPKYGPYPKTTTLRMHKNTISLDEILLEPGRLTRPPKIVIIFRGPPGSGKSVLAKLIKDQEAVIGGNSPRILSIDDYYTVEEEKEEVDPITGKKTMKIESRYEYVADKEDDYMQYLVRSLKKTLTDGLFDFVLVDAWNDKLHHYFELHDLATKHGYVAYTIELLYAFDVCLDHNVHNRSPADIKNMIVNWKSLPPKHILLDATNLIQFSMNEAIEEAQAANQSEQEPTKNNEETGNGNAEAKKDSNEDPIDTPMDSIEVDLAAEQETEDLSDEVEETGFFKSKWEDDATENKLARLDGVSKPLRHPTIEDYLQMDGWEPPKSSSNGKKRVRWADIVAKNEQQKMKQLGFVVGHTDWSKMMDPTEGSSALCDIKYIEKAPKFRKLE
ncbi:YLP motif-containing protein 1-like [Culicoides brevitarsis]|uniref:YLP motif-containing protein 1-like n=1 Tax=Culicoides brevitarsis TaxID=469753 RepID=UPI00307C09E7